MENFTKNNIKIKKKKKGTLSEKNYYLFVTAVLIHTLAFTFTHSCTLSHIFTR